MSKSRKFAAANLVNSAMAAMNGWLGPPGLKTGWYQAYLALGDLVDPNAKERVEAGLRRLQTGDFADAAERINLERAFVAQLIGGCRKVVIGYTVKREYFNAEFSAGIENIGYDSLTGLNSPIFIRTVKLKDFPWNGWLALGIDGRPHGRVESDRGLHRSVRPADVVGAWRSGALARALRLGVDGQPRLGCSGSARPMSASKAMSQFHAGDHDRLAHVHR